MTRQSKNMLIGKIGHKRFTIPVDFVTQTAAVLARRSVGKSYCAGVIAEGLLERGQQVIVLDPLNAWWGLRTASGGKKPGYSVVIFGGPHGDLPLEENMAVTLARLVAERPNLSCVLSMRHLRKDKMKRFVTTFCKELFHIKGNPKLMTPLHLFIDECDHFVPQRMPKGSEEMVGALEDIVRRGRQSGLGCTMISQRPQAVNKTVLSQIELLIAGQVTGAHDKNAIREWIKDNASEEKQGAFIRSLAKLKVGQFWFWSPAWLDILCLVKVRKKWTFDSSATPKMGKTPKATRKVREVGLDSLREALGGILEDIQASDPQALQQRIFELERELQNAKKPMLPSEARVDEQEIARRVSKAVAEHNTVWQNRIRKTLATTEKKIVLKLDEARAGVSGRLANLSDSIIKTEQETVVGIDKVKADISSGLAGLSEDVCKLVVPTVVSPNKSFAVEPKFERAVRNPSIGAPYGGDGELGGMKRKLLTVLAQRGVSCAKTLLVLRSGYVVNSGSVSGALSELRKKEYIDGPWHNIRLTQRGLDVLGPFEPLPTGMALIEHWATQLQGRRFGKAVSVIFRFIADQYPNQVSKEQIMEGTNYKESGTFAGALGKLRNLGLIEGKGEAIKLSSEVVT